MSNNKRRSNTRSHQPKKSGTDENKNEEDKTFFIKGTNDEFVVETSYKPDYLSLTDYNTNPWYLNAQTEINKLHDTSIWSNIGSIYNPLSNIANLSTSINSVYGLGDAMRTATSISATSWPQYLGTSIPDYSKLGIMSSSMDFSSSLNNPIPSFDIAKPINYANDKSYENLINFNYDNSSKINDLEKKLTKTNSKIKDLEFKNESLEIKTAEYEVLLKDKNSDEEELLLYKQRGHITSRISNIHLSNLIQSKDFFNEFEDLKSVDAVVISIDIRKSTELMLKAVSPQAFAKFITQLSKLLSTCVKLNYGVFDKFTGDGILAFFPKFLSGDHALLFALKTAMECHTIFEEHYKKHEFSFQVFNKSIGLGIGIECGEVAIVNNGVELTIVGTPVVYACRLGGAPSYTTLIGQKAMQTINEKLDMYVEVENDELNIKHEGIIGVYKLKKLKHLEKFLQVPDWSKYIKTNENDNEAEENIKEEYKNDHKDQDIK